MCSKQSLPLAFSFKNKKELSLTSTKTQRHGVSWVNLSRGLLPCTNNLTQLILLNQNKKSLVFLLRPELDHLNTSSSQVYPWNSGLEFITEKSHDQRFIFLMTGEAGGYEKLFSQRCHAPVCSIRPLLIRELCIFAQLQFITRCAVVKISHHWPYHMSEFNLGLWHNWASSTVENEHSSLLQLLFVI